MADSDLARIETITASWPGTKLRKAEFDNAWDLLYRDPLAGCNFPALLRFESLLGGGRLRQLAVKLRRDFRNVFGLMPATAESRAQMLFRSCHRRIISLRTILRAPGVFNWSRLYQEAASEALGAVEREFDFDYARLNHSTSRKSPSGVSPRALVDCIALNGTFWSIPPQSLPRNIEDPIVEALGMVLDLDVRGLGMLADEFKQEYFADCPMILDPQIIRSCLVLQALERGVQALQRTPHGSGKENEPGVSQSLRYLGIACRNALCRRGRFLMAFVGESPTVSLSHQFSHLTFSKYFRLDDCSMYEQISTAESYLHRRIPVTFSSAHASPLLLVELERLGMKFRERAFTVACNRELGQQPLEFGPESGVASEINWNNSLFTRNFSPKLAPISVSGLLNPDEASIYIARQIRV